MSRAHFPSDRRPLGIRRLASLLLFSLLALPATASADWVASGSFHYRDRLQDLDGFTGATVDRPARLVDVQIIDAGTSAVLATGATDLTGAFSIPVVDASVRDVNVRFLTRSSATAGLFLQVENNQLNHTVYAVVGTPVPGHDPNTNVDFGALTALPQAGGEPFNCYDVALNGHDFLKSFTGGWPGTGLILFWQAGGSDGTYFRSSDNTIHLTGDEGYDDTVIAHEHGHFISKSYSKDNNPGGAHFLGDNNQDIRLSWSEGYATYWGNSVRRELSVTSPAPTHYIDTTGLPGSGNLDFSYELETPSVNAVGGASEVAVQALLWDITDDAATIDGTPGVDDDPISSASDSDIWEVTLNYFPQASVTNVSLEDFWDGWFRPGFSHGLDAEMTQTFAALRVEFFEDAFENDDGVGAAQQIAATGAPQAHTFYPAGDGDFAWFPATTGQSFIVETTDLISDANTLLALTDSLGAVLVSNDNRAGGDESSRVLFTAPYDGRFFARVTHAADLGVYGSYNLRLTAGSPSAVTFQSVAGAAGMTANSNSRGIAWGDYDDDGFMDLYVTNVSSQNLLYRNQGNGTFVNDAVLRGVALVAQSEGACWGDYDKDGDLDLYVASVDADDVLYQNQLQESGIPNFLNVTVAALITDAASGRTPCWIDADRDGQLDLFVANVENGTCKLWRNLGNGTFQDVSAAAGLDVTGAISACWADVDLDGDSDVFIAVNSGPSLLFRNDGGTFTDVTPTSGTTGGTGTFGAHWGDFDGDGLYDLTIADSNGANFLYRNLGGFVFEDVSVEANAASPFTGVGSIFVDHDLDGDLDIYAANFNAVAQLYDNVTGGSFSVTGAASTSSAARSAAFADYDNDGDADLLVSTQTTNLLFRNGVISPHWVQVRTIGSESNRDGYGARVLVSADGRRQWREVTSGHGFGSQNDPRALFGLGPGATLVDTLIVDWPSGKRSFLTGLAIDTLWVVDETGAIAVDDPPLALGRVQLSVPRPNPSSSQAAFQLRAPQHLAGTPMQLEMYDVAGRHVRTVWEGIAGEAPVQTSWDLRDGDGRRVRPGVYLAQLRCGPERTTQKVVTLQP